SYNFRKSALDEHAASQQHNEANKKEAASLRMVTVSNNAISNAHQHVLQMMKMIFWLVSEDIALNKIKSFIDLAQFIEVPYIKKEGHITYANYNSALQMLEAMSILIDNDLWNELKNSSAIGILIDESTDIATESHIIVYVKYCLYGIVKVRYLQLLQLEHGDAKSIYNAIYSLFDKHKLCEKIMAFASDGASVMMGKNNGVATQFSKNNLYLFVTHCIVHRLSLACEKAQKQVDFCNHADLILEKTYLFFHKSPKRYDILYSYQELLNSPKLKIHQLHKIRWLSRYEVVKNFCRTLEPLLDSLYEIYKTSEKKQTKESTIELYNNICNWRTLAFIHFLYDILGYLATLCLALQHRYIRFSDINPKIEATINKIYDEYLELDTDGKPKLGIHLNKFLELTKSSQQYINSHKLKYTSNCKNNLMGDIFDFASLVIDEIKSRFPMIRLLDAMQILNPNEWPKDKNKLTNYGTLELEQLIEFYKKPYLPNYPNGIIEADSLRQEWNLFKEVIYTNYQNLNIENLLPIIFDQHYNFYPNIIKLLEIVYSIPFSSVECERGFSKQNLIKIDIRNRLSNNNLHLFLSLSLVDKNFKDFDYEKALKIWLNM
ncbi:6749_t:CDS:2, partial [Cetraspora pellucida]